MNQRQNAILLLILVFSSVIESSFAASAVADFCVRPSASVQTNPPQILLSWPGDANSRSYTLHRKLRDESAWGAGIMLASNATSYLDTNVSAGAAYEYWISKYAYSYYGEGYIYAGIEAPLVEARGKVILIADNTCVSGLSNELARLEEDLAGDGWFVIRHDVPRMATDPANTSSGVWAARSNELAATKALIVGDYLADSQNVKAVFLFGHVPVPYSGDIGPDDHPNHLGAWPADVFYADMEGAWTDSIVAAPYASDTRTWNVVGDGKFDQNEPPKPLKLQIGRVDLSNLPAFPQSELELLRRYLNKDHNFRHKIFSVEPRGLIDDNLGIMDGEVPAINGWRNFASLVGETNTFEGEWITTLTSQTYLWGYGCGAGDYMSASGVANTWQCVTNDTQVVFTMLFGSYFGDWDSQNNLMRAQLCTSNYTLTCCWASRPNWFFHGMGLGETIGYNALVTQNNSSLYDANLGYRSVHIALMGDPTLRMNPVAPPSRLTVTPDGSGAVALNWGNSPDTVLGYHVYRATSSAGPFTRLTSNLVSGSSYTDSLAGPKVYMIRAVKLEIMPSGSYYNASQAIFQTLGTGGGPSITLLQPTNNSVFLAPANVQLTANAFDPANEITNISFYANGTKLGDTMPPIYSLTWSNVPVGIYSLTVRGYYSGGQATNGNVVMIRVDHGGSPLLWITSAGNGAFALSGQDVLGRIYRIQALEDLTSSRWHTIGNATSSASGTFQFFDFTAPAERFYRTVYP